MRTTRLVLVVAALTLTACVPVPQTREEFRAAACPKLP